MRKNFGAKPWTYPQPVFILAAYDENGTPNAMNAAWGGISEDKELSMYISEGHKTTANILARKAFTVSMATADQMVACDYVGIESGNQVSDKVAKAGWHTTKSEFVEVHFMGPNPNAIYPNEKIKQVVYIKNVITRPNIIVGEYTYYDDINGAEKFEDHVSHHYEFLGDKLIIGKFCAIAKGIEFVMNGANHRMNSVTTYPFNIMGGGWEQFTPSLEDLPLKGDTVVGNDVWIGQNVTVMPGVHIGDGSIIAANSVVTKNIPPYSIAGGNPCRLIRKRFDDDLIAYLLNLKWWDWDADKIFRNMDALCSGNLQKIKHISEL